MAHIVARSWPPSISSSTNTWRSSDKPSPPRAYLVLRGQNRDVAFYGFRNATQEEIRKLFDWAQSDVVTSSGVLPGPVVTQTVQAQQINKFDIPALLEILSLLVGQGYSIEDILEGNLPQEYEDLRPQLLDFLSLIARYLETGKTTITIGFSFSYFLGISFAISFDLSGLASDPLVKQLPPLEAAKFYFSLVMNFFRANRGAYEKWRGLLEQLEAAIPDAGDRREFLVALTLVLGRLVAYGPFGEGTRLLGEHLTEFVERLQWIFANAGEFGAQQWQDILANIGYFLGQLASVPYSDTDKYIEHLANWAAGLIVYGGMLEQLANGVLTRVYGPVSDAFN
ncbi:MAG: hypothetical protein NUW06_08380 [Candidatus Acetothermia bacterium]|nr:hypothetical protein [Candidatus Acetothermia bacterium]MDH7505867.1 hypothetical protein [Candidatus Acetothermia bacterium]